MGLIRVRVAMASGFWVWCGGKGRLNSAEWGHLLASDVLVQLRIQKLNHIIIRRHVAKSVTRVSHYL